MKNKRLEKITSLFRKRTLVKQKSKVQSNKKVYKRDKNKNWRKEI